MFGDRLADFRSYEKIETIANKVRKLGHITAHSQFDIVALIEGPLIFRLKTPLSIEIFDPADCSVPALVTFHGGRSITLKVSSALWNLAKAKSAFARFVLGHEIGHIVLHNHDALAYSKLLPSEIKNFEAEVRTEPQANLFADLLLVPTNMLNGFRSAEEIEYFFNVPTECAERRFAFIEDRKRRRSALYVGEACPECANFTLVRNGTCLKCNTCGGTTGCS